MLNYMCDCVLYVSYLNTRLFVMCRFNTGEVINYIIPLFFSSTLSSLCPIFYIDHLSKAAGGLIFALRDKFEDS